MTFFPRKMIPIETRYETYNPELLAIVEAFKTWHHYLESFKYKLFVRIDNNNLCKFLDTKSLSSCQIWWAQKLSFYYFWFNYYQKKANKAANALFQFSQRFTNKKIALRVENIQILYHLQFSLTKASLSDFSLSNHDSGLFSLYLVFIWGTHGFPWLRQFSNKLQTRLISKKPYKVNIDRMRLGLIKLQVGNQ